MPTHPCVPMHSHTATHARVCTPHRHACPPTAMPTHAHEHASMLAHMHGYRLARMHACTHSHMHTCPYAHT